MKDLPAPDGNRFEALVESCRSRGVAMTVQRRAVIEALSRDDTHPSIDDVHAEVGRRYPEVSRSTVYRILESLVEAGLVRKVNHPGRTLRYDARVDRHHHHVCTVCERVIDVEHASLDGLTLGELPSRHEGFTVQDFSVYLFGVCRSCAESASD